MVRKLGKKPRRAREPAFFLGGEQMIGRILSVFVVFLVVIGASQWLRGHSLGEVIPDALFWSTISTGLFAATAVWKKRRGERCAVCVPER